jgi:EAL domain-containing protein (putative c-di-GMP-specific phosphodiesterase class I)/DNA-binding NarL/FixJ family response regulator
VQSIRVLIADDETEVRAALADLIGSEPSMELVGAAADAAEAIEMAQAHRPDVALVDVKMPSGGGPRAAREITRRSPQTRVLALSAYEDRTTVLEMLGAGAVGYLVKGTAPDEIVRAIQRAVRGQTSVSSEVMASVVHELSAQLQRDADAAEERRNKTSRVRRAIEQGSFRLVYQPIFRLHGEPVGYEALARFEGPPERTPDVWFREAAEVNLGLDLELTAVHRALADLDRLTPGAYLSLNVSHRTATSPLLLDAVDRAPLDRLVFEITEHERVEEYERLATSLGQLRARGARIAIDDAGAGFASLRHILRLAPDIIKLDISLTRDIDVDRGRRALAAALISFAEEMEMSIVAEGIETKAEMETLRALGVRFGQGFYLALPSSLP